MRENTRMIDRSCRQVEREITKLNGLEKKAMDEVTKLAKTGNHTAAKTNARTVAQIRSQRNNLTQMKANLTSISIQLSSVSTQKSVMTALSATTGVMQKANAEMNVADIMKMMKEFEKEKMKAEINGEAMTDAMDMEDATGEADDVYNSILDEIGVVMDDPDAVGKGKLGVNPVPAKMEEAKNDGEIDDLEARLAALG